MKYYYYCAAIFLPILMFTSCGKHTGDYRMEQNDFIYPLASLLAYQQVLDTELSKVQDQAEFAPFLTHRKESMAGYINELQSMYPLLEAPLTAEAKANLLNLENSQGAGHNKLLLQLVMQADEDLIGLHVKASGPAGLKDAVLREWTAAKLPVLTKRLDASQILWQAK